MAASLARVLTVAFLLPVLTFLMWLLTPDELNATSEQNLWPAPGGAYHVADSFLLRDFADHLKELNYPVEFSITLGHLKRFRICVEKNIKGWLAYKNSENILYF